jgi:hypothetical protein
MSASPSIWGSQLMTVAIVIGTALIMFVGLWVLPHLLSRIFDHTNPDEEWLSEFEQGDK